VTDAEATAILHRFLETGFEGGRHQRRVEKIDHA
jgi:ribose 5-phosphate isomerase RpiB